MNRKLTPFALLFVSLLCFMATAALHFNVLFNQYAAENAAEVKNIAGRVQHCIDDATNEADAIGRQLKQNTVSFSSLLRQTHYPTFIYKGSRLIFWSNHTIIPELYFGSVPNQPSVVSNEYGTFIVVPRQSQYYTIFTFIPLQVDYSIRNSFLTPKLDEAIFRKTDLRLDLDPQAKLPQVRTRQHTFLFAVDFKAGRNQSGSENLQLALLALGSFFFILFSIVLSRRFLQRGQYNTGIALLLFLLFIFRIALLLLNLPFSIAETELFDPRLYAASFWSPSIGDLALNMLLLTTIAGSGIYLFQKNKAWLYLKLLPQTKSRLLQLGCFVAFYLLLVLLYRFYYGVYHNSPLVLDVSQSLEFTRYKLIIYGVMLLHTISLSMFTYILATMVSLLLQRETKLWAYQLLALTGVVMALLAVVMAPQMLVLMLLGTLFWFLIVLATHYRQTINSPYRTYLFFFLVVIISALMGAYALYNHYQGELKMYKQDFAYKLLKDNDVLGEYLLEHVADSIAGDALIQAKMMGPYVDADFIKRKITKQYLRNYFDKYETSVLLFDYRGRTLESRDTTASTLQELRRKYDTPQTRTERHNLFLVKDPTRYNARTYFKLIEVPVGNWQKGTIVLQLTLKKLLPNSVVPELLVDRKSNEPFRMDMLSYAIYGNRQLRYSEGEYDYATNFNKRLLRRPELYQQGANQGNYHHLGIKGDNGQTLVITTEKYGGREVLSNFSFLFLMFIAGLIVSGFIYLLTQRHRYREFSPNFSTKIQIFLNFGILLPLLLVSITTASLVTASYKKDLMNAYEQRGEAIQENLGRLLDSHLLVQRKGLIQKVEEVASIAEADVNLYDRNGRLLVTSQPLIFEAGLLSKLVNPEAFAAISERQALRVLLEEQAGNLSFNAVYLPLHSNRNPGELQGFIGIPFFDSEKQLDLKLIELVTTTMNIFSVMFIVFMVLTFFASRALTVPLRMLADKLKRTSLTGKNEMLAYKGADEIGMLVNEYNRMLLTLEQNKVDLAMQEKEAAWREMARQVAHEIKNPLTPMKLSLQYLQKAIAEKKPNTEELISKISHTLITQINILSDIATSFSSFTSMPEPKTERMDVAAALQKAVDLHNDPATAVLTTAIPVEAVMVMADESLLVRTFNNLLLNAIQAVPASRKPHLKVALQSGADHSVLISIQDNGSGIPDDIRDKVFIPNFSTKYTGSGIGLAVAKKGIENAGGRIWFETESGKGTTFYISLPLARG
ncbi:sensor histidine kinase [Pontibacter liquoris]|uniref:sensor histidine kinase n=1 Tax=Pontibacter liquoris TaxID=2905677 RepID=UPI001FA6DBDE|nr:ATP-binding protein [Pontibacter liquoris]